MEFLEYAYLFLTTPSIWGAVLQYYLSWSRCLALFFPYYFPLFISKSVPFSHQGLHWQRFSTKTIFSLLLYKNTGYIQIFHLEVIWFLFSWFLNLKMVSNNCFLLYTQILWESTENYSSPVIPAIFEILLGEDTNTMNRDSCMMAWLSLKRTVKIQSR